MNYWVTQRTDAGIVQTPALQLDGQRVAPIFTRSSMPAKSLFNLSASFLSPSGGSLLSPFSLTVAPTYFNVTDVSQAAPAVVTVVGHGLSSGNYIQISNGSQESIVGLWKIEVIDSDTFSLVGSDSSEDVTFDTTPDAQLIYCIAADDVGQGLNSNFLIRKIIFNVVTPTETPLGTDSLFGISPGESPAFILAYGKRNKEATTFGLLPLLSITTFADFMKFGGDVKYTLCTGTGESILRIELTFWDDYALFLRGNDLLYLVLAGDLSGLTDFNVGFQLETVTFDLEEDLVTL